MQKQPNKKQSSWEKHKPFIGSIYAIALVISSIYSIVERILLVFQSGFDTSMTLSSRIISTALQIVFFTFFVILSAGFGTILYGTLALALLFIPYLVIRKLLKK